MTECGRRRKMRHPPGESSPRRALAITVWNLANATQPGRVTCAFLCVAASHPIQPCCTNTLATPSGRIPFAFADL